MQRGLTVSLHACPVLLLPMTESSVDVQHRPPWVAGDGFGVRFDRGTKFPLLVQLVPS